MLTLRSFGPGMIAGPQDDNLKQGGIDRFAQLEKGTLERCPFRFGQKYQYYQRARMRYFKTEVPLAATGMLN